MGVRWLQWKPLIITNRTGMQLQELHSNLCYTFQFNHILFCLLAEGLFLLTVLLLASAGVTWLIGISKGSGMLERLIDIGLLWQSSMSGIPVSPQATQLHTACLTGFLFPSIRCLQRSRERLLPSRCLCECDLGWSHRRTSCRVGWPPSACRAAFRGRMAVIASDEAIWKRSEANKGVP